MSKIYEALLRAELERAAQNGRSSGVAERGAAEAFSNTAQSPFVPETSAFAEAFTEPLLVVPPPNLVSIPRKHWRPELSRLPALEKQGRPVEQFRSLRSHLVEFRDLNKMKSVLVASGSPGEGKSFIAANLALSLARYKATRVLLIDGDMRRSTLHNLLGAARTPGLTDYLSGTASLLSVLQRAEPIPGKDQIHAAFESLSFIAAGPDSDKAGDLSGNARFGELISAVDDLFDWIIVDSPPIAVVSDGVNLARSCDGVLLVARQGVTQFKTAQHAQIQFKNSRVIGFVLNAMHNLPLKNDYYGTYTEGAQEVEDAT